MNLRSRFFSVSVAAITRLGFGPVLAHAEGFSTAPAPSVTASKVADMGRRYFTELLGVHSKAQVERQLEPIAQTEPDTVVCCPMSWRFYNFPSAVDTTWREPDKYPGTCPFSPTE